MFVLFISCILGVSAVFANEATEGEEISFPYEDLQITYDENKLSTLRNSTITSYDEFLALPLGENEKKLIYKIISTVGDKNPIKLAFLKKSLDKKGKKIYHVHPFRLLGYVFSDPRLKSSMKEIRKNHFKWTGFMDGFSKKMKEESAKDNLMRYVPGFAEHLHVNEEDIANFIRKRDWDGLVRFLI